MTLITISAAYGAGGSRIAPALADHLGVPFLGRPPVPGLDERPSGDQEGAEERAGEEGLIAAPGKLLSRIASLAVSWGTPAGMTADELLPDHQRREELEAEVRAFAKGGTGVVLGRAAVVLLRGDPGVLHVLLDGPVEARTLQAMEIEAIDRQTAERRIARIDRFRRAYLEDLYGVDYREPGVFDLMVDSTSMSVDATVAIVAAAVRARP
jgi:cytidylate kinase